MEENPYQPPVIAAQTLEEEQQPERGPRPFGIWLLAGLHLLVGFLFIVGALFFIWQLVIESDVAWRQPVWFMALACAGMAVLSLASSVGMWFGAKWGWWLGAFYYVWSALGAPLQIPLDLWSIGLDEMADNPGYVVRRLGNLVISALIVLYFFEGTVRDFFRLRSLRMLYALLLLGSISIVLVAGAIAMALFHGSAAME